MKAKILKIAGSLLIMAGSFSCHKDDDIDMSKINFSNIEDLYAQPLPVIKKAVQGKWKVYRICGGDAGCVYLDNTFVEFGQNTIIINDDSGQYLPNHGYSYSWKKKKVEVNGKLVDSYVMWPDDADKTNKSSQQGGYFISIKNDTLYSRGSSLTSDWTIMGRTYIRVK